jgi:hypothetical protein
MLDNGVDVEAQGAPYGHALPVAPELNNEDETFEAESVTVWPKQGMTPR